MTLENWPPSRGPKPSHLQVKEVRVEPERTDRMDFTFRQPRIAVTERKLLLEAIGHPATDKGLRVVTPTVSIPKGEKVQLQVVTRQRRLKNHSNFTFDYHVATVASLTSIQAINLLSSNLGEKGIDPRVLTVDLTYPLTMGVRVKMRPYTLVEEFEDGHERTFKEMTLGYVLWVMAHEYIRIYEEHKKYRVWGHELDDLHFGGLYIRKGRGRLVVDA